MCTTTQVRPLIRKMSPTWGTHGCVTLPDLLPRLILFPKPLHNPHYLTAPLSIRMPPTDPLIPTLCPRPLDQSTLLHVLPMTQRLNNRTILTTLPPKLAYLHKRVGRPASKRAAARMNTRVYLINHPKLSWTS